MSASLRCSDRAASRPGDGGCGGDVHDRALGRIGGGGVPSFVRFDLLAMSSRRQPATTCDEQRSWLSNTQTYASAVPMRQSSLLPNVSATARCSRWIGPLRDCPVVHRRQSHPSPVVCCARRNRRAARTSSTAIDIASSSESSSGSSGKPDRLGSSAMSRPITSAAARSDCSRKCA